ncbi:MAG TPA: hypothetical protein VLZ83_05515 [Edaphocola sp.]|nr:hypothetical protein [Edaphocola sp.]
MKNIIEKLILFFSIFFIVSCDPDVSGENVTLEPLEFGFTVNEDTTQHTLGDTIYFNSEIPNSYNLDNGKVSLFFSVVVAPGVDTITNPNQIKEAIENIDYKMIKIHGDIEYHSSIEGYMRQIFLNPSRTDSLHFEYAFIPLREGVYHFSFANSFYQGTNGKARTSAMFNVINPNWNLIKISSVSIPNPSDKGYFKGYLFAVFE